MKFRSRFKLTSFELASLSLLAAGISLTVAILMMHNCNNLNRAAFQTAQTDSIINELDIAKPLPTDSSITKKNRKTKQKAVGSEPISRNHLDEIVNE